MFRFALCVLLSGGCLAASEGKTPFKVQSTLDVAYIPNAGERQRLDVFRPEVEAKKRNHNSIFFRASAADDPVHMAIVAFVQKHGPRS